MIEKLMFWKKKEKRTKKQFTVFHMFGEGNICSTDGDSYSVLVMDAVSQTTKETIMFPVIILENNDDETHVIPFTSIVDLVYNFGFRKDLEVAKEQILEEKKKLEEKKEVVANHHDSGYI